MIICWVDIIEIIHIYSRGKKIYCYYRRSGTIGKVVYYLRYDAERNPQNPWPRSTDGSGQDISLEPITRTELTVSETRIHLWNLSGNPTKSIRYNNF